MGIHWGQLDFDDWMELWQRYDAGKAPSAISRIMDRRPSTIGANSGAKVDAQQVTLRYYRAHAP